MLLNLHGSSEAHAPCEISWGSGECGGVRGAAATAGDLGRGGDEPAPVRHLWGCPAPAEYLHEDRLELVPEDAVDEDVDGRVDGDEQVGHLDQLVEPELVVVLHGAELLEDVADERQDVADEEDDHDDEEHHSQVVVLLLLIAQYRPSGVRPPGSVGSGSVFDIALLCFCV